MSVWVHVTVMALAYVAIYGALVVGLFREHTSLGVAWSAAQAFLPGKLVPTVESTGR
jgi:hypothetical protein